MNVSTFIDGCGQERKYDGSIHFEVQDGCREDSNFQGRSDGHAALLSDQCSLGIRSGKVSCKTNLSRSPENSIDKKYLAPSHSGDGILRNLCESNPNVNQSRRN